MNYKIYKLDEINLDKIIYSKPVSYNKDTSSIHISYNDPIHGNVPFLIQSPALYCVDGITKTGSNSITHELLLCLQSKNEKDTTQVKSFFEQLDKKFIMDAKNKYSWNESSKKLTYKVLMRQTNDSNPFHSNGVLKIKFIKNNGFETKVFNKIKSIIHPDNYLETFSNKCYVKLILECVSLWKNKSNIFTLYIRPHQIRVDYAPPPVNVLTNYSFMDETEDENNKLLMNKGNNEIDSYSYESDSIESDSIDDIDSVDSVDSDIKQYHNKLMEHMSTDDIQENEDKLDTTNSTETDIQINKFKPESLTELKNQESFKYNSDDLFALSTQINSQYTHDKRTDTSMIQDAMQHIHDDNMNSSSEFSNDLNVTNSSILN